MTKQTIESILKKEIVNEMTAEDLAEEIQELLVKKIRECNAVDKWVMTKDQAIEIIEKS